MIDNKKYLSNFFPYYKNVKFPESKEKCEGKEIPYLDDIGYVKLLNVNGSDAYIARGARTSFRQEEYKSDEKNAGLIKYLMEHRHTSPFELPSMVFQTRIPLFVRAQHIRHRTQSCNWESQRYSETKCEFYVPPVERIRTQDKFNKQKSGDKLSEEDPEIARKMIRENCLDAFEDYMELLDMGVSRETARGVLNQQFYTTGVWTFDLHNLFHYLGLRNDPHAQPEIQLLADIVENFVAICFPASHNAFVNFKKDSVEFSKKQITYLRDFFSNYSVDEFDHWKFNSSRRRKEFLNKLGLST